MEKEEVVRPLCEDYMIVYIGKPGKSVNKLLESMQFRKIHGYQLTSTLHLE